MLVLKKLINIMKNNAYYNLLFVNEETGIYRSVFLQNTQLKADCLWKEVNHGQGGNEIGEFWELE